MAFSRSLREYAGNSYSSNMSPTPMSEPSDANADRIGSSTPKTSKRLLLYTCSTTASLLNQRSSLCGSDSPSALCAMVQVNDLLPWARNTVKAMPSRQSLVATLPCHSLFCRDGVRPIGGQLGEHTARKPARTYHTLQQIQSVTYSHTMQQQLHKSNSSILWLRRPNPHFSSGRVEISNGALWCVGAPPELLTITMSCTAFSRNSQGVAITICKSTMQRVVSGQKTSNSTLLQRRRYPAVQRVLGHFRVHSYNTSFLTAVHRIAST